MPSCNSATHYTGMAPDKKSLRDEKLLLESQERAMRKQLFEMEVALLRRELELELLEQAEDLLQEIDEKSPETIQSELQHLSDSVEETRMMLNVVEDELALIRNDFE